MGSIEYENVYVKQGNDLYGFRRFLWEWLEILRGYQDWIDDDSLYWYNERATLSTLAGALWRDEWHVLEEFVCVKKASGKKENDGRVDIWFASKKHGQYGAEAKQWFQSIGSQAEIDEDKITKGLRAYLKNDAQQSKRCFKDLDVTLLQFLFVAPKLPSSYFGKPEKVRERVDWFIQDVVEQVDCDFYAHYFDPDSQLQDEYTEYIYPGVVLFGSVLK